MLLSDAARVIHMTHSSHNKMKDLELEAYRLRERLETTTEIVYFFLSFNGK